MTALPARVRRWTAARKEEVIQSIKRGDVTCEVALRTHGISEEEMASWLIAHHRHGQAGLLATKIGARA